MGGQGFAGPGWSGMGGGTMGAGMPRPGMMGPGLWGGGMGQGMMGPMWGQMQPATPFVAPYGAFHCPVCGYSGSTWHAGPSPSATFASGSFAPWVSFGGLGGLRRHGGAYSPQFTATGLPTDEEITEMIYDTLDADPFVPYDADINVEVDSGIVTLAGTVPNKRVKHAVGDDSWWVPGVVDVRNNIQVSGHRRVKSAPREGQVQGQQTK